MPLEVANRPPSVTSRSIAAPQGPQPIEQAAPVEEDYRPNQQQLPATRYSEQEPASPGPMSPGSRRTSFKPPPKTRVESPVRESETAEQRKLAALLLQQQAALQKSQYDQAKQLEQLQQELRKGLTSVSNAIATSGSPRPRDYALTDDRRRNYTASSENINQKLEGLRGGNLQSRLTFSSLSRHDPMDSLPSQMPRSVPLPVAFDQSTNRMIANPTVVTFQGDLPADAPNDSYRSRGGRGRGDRSRDLEREEYENAVMRLGKEPRPIPSHVQPYSTSTIDIDSSVTVLRSGDWFWKWNDKGNIVQPRYIWLDTEKNVISWGKERGAASLLSGYIRIEQIVEVTTTQMTENGPDDVPRVYYVLLIQTINRLLQMATEKKEKLNQWYDALTNIALFYRVRGTMTHAFDPSTE